MYNYKFSKVRFYWKNNKLKATGQYKIIPKSQSYTYIYKISRVRQINKKSNQNTYISPILIIIAEEYQKIYNQ